MKTLACRLSFILVVVLILSSVRDAAGADHGPAMPGAVVYGILNALVRDGLIDKNCLREQKNKAGIVTVKPVRLSRGNEMQYIAVGNPPCIIGARSPMYYIYSSAGLQYKLIAEIGLADDVSTAKTETNGWKDIIVTVTIETGARTEKSLFKYNGTRYVKK